MLSAWRPVEQLGGGVSFWRAARICANPNVGGFEISEESFSDELREDQPGQSRCGRGTEGVRQRGRHRPGPKHGRREARAKAKMILETIIVPRVDALNRVLAENEGLRGGVVENGERGEDNFSQLIGYNRRDNFPFCGISKVRS